MKLKYMLLFIASVLIIVACEKVENDMPDVRMTAGSKTYKLNDDAFLRFSGDTLFKYSPSAKEEISYTLNNDTLTSSLININKMFSEKLFPVTDNEIVTFSGEVLSFGFEGEADGVVVFYGDSTKRGESHNYAEYPYAHGTAIAMSDDDNTGNDTYKYWQEGEYTATLVATNFWRTEADPKEQNQQIKVIVLDKEALDYIE